MSELVWFGYLVACYEDLVFILCAFVIALDATAYCLFVSWVLFVCYLGWCL